MTEYPCGWYYRQRDYLFESATGSWHFMAGNAWLNSENVWSRWANLPDGWIYIEGEYVLSGGRWYWVNPDLVYGHDMTRGQWATWSFTEKPPLTYRLTSLPWPQGALPNTINMIAIPGENKALLLTAQIGFKSGYASQIIKIDGKGTAQILKSTGNETVGHGAFYGPDGREIIMPVEHGSAKPWIYRGGNLFEGAKQPGRWGLSGCVIDGEAVVATSNAYQSGMFNDRPVVCRVRDGKEIRRYPQNGLLWDMWTHRGQTCAINCYGNGVLYRGSQAENTSAKMGCSYRGMEVLGGGNRSGRGVSDGRIWVNGREFSTPCQSIEVLYVTHKGRCFACGINPDNLYQIHGGVPHLIASVGGDPKHSGGWSFGVGFAELDDGTILFARTGKNGSSLYRLDLAA